MIRDDNDIIEIIYKIFPNVEGELFNCHWCYILWVSNHTVNNLTYDVISDKLLLFVKYMQHIFLQNGIFIQA